MTTSPRPLEIFISQVRPGIILEPNQRSPLGQSKRHWEGKLSSRHLKSGILNQHSEGTRLLSYKPPPLPSLITLSKAVLWKCVQIVLDLGTRLFPPRRYSDNGRLLFETAYGLRIIVHNDDRSHTTIEITTSQSSDNQADQRVQDAADQLYHYRLKPDWQTSFLWYDIYWPHNPPDETHVDEETIEERYPSLASFYFAWQTLYEDWFTTRDCHRGSGLDVFPDVASRVGWEVEGFLFACWLALQSDVEQVEYEVDTGTYSIRKENLSSVAQTFLADVDTLL
ncbi:hypothetical protein FQN54_008401 [Arachnomyces sp. PD_36]|nr:hypothetical protein FQN54_008401 [Arachnomyces sp. PD_36]